MNILLLHTNLRESARLLNNKHLGKQMVELMQAIGTACHTHGWPLPHTKKGGPYRPMKAVGLGRQMVDWVGRDPAHIAFCDEYLCSLNLEYNERFHKDHACFLQCTHWVYRGGLKAAIEHERPYPSHYLFVGSKDYPVAPFEGPLETVVAAYRAYVTAEKGYSLEGQP